MAEAMTYDSLVNDVKTYAERSDAPFITQIPRFIMMAENRIASEVRGLGYLRIVNGAMSAGDNTIEKPARWRETSHIMLTDGSNEAKFLTQRSYTFCRSYWPDQTLQAEPEAYSDYGYEHLLVVPTPDAAYSFEMGYYERPVPLDASNQTNWTTQYAPQLILFATLLEAQPWLKLSNRTAEFQALYDRAAAAVQSEAERRMFGDQSLSRSHA